MPKLTDTQFAMLSAAAQRADGAVGLPANLKGATAQKAAARLLREGLVEEVSAGLGTPIALTSPHVPPGNPSHDRSYST